MFTAIFPPYLKLNTDGEHEINKVRISGSDKFSII